MTETHDTRDTGRGRHTAGEWNMVPPSLHEPAVYDWWVVDGNGHVILRTGTWHDLREQEANARLASAAPKMFAKLEKIVAWLEKLAASSEQQAKDTRFITLSEANIADAKNYRATIADIQSVLKKATTP